MNPKVNPKVNLKEMLGGIDGCIACLTREGPGPDGQCVEDREVRLRRAAFMLGGIRRELAALVEAMEKCEAIRRGPPS